MTRRTQFFMDPLARSSLPRSNKRCYLPPCPSADTVKSSGECLQVLLPSYLTLRTGI